MKVQNNQFLSIEQLQAKYFTQSKQSKKSMDAGEGLRFQDILNELKLLLCMKKIY